MQTNADNAQVLPKGIARTRLNSKFFFPIDERYNADGDAENVAEDYNINLTSYVSDAYGITAQDLQTLESAFGMPAGSATFGGSLVSFEYTFKMFDFFYEYGLTDHLTIGIKIPYWSIKNDLIEFATEKATIGLNPNYGEPSDPYGSQLIPVALGGEKVNVEDLQNLLVQLYGYKRLESWSYSGLSDVELGGRYQYLKTENWRLAFTGAVRVPTGEEDDPDNLMDYASGSGTYAFLFQFHQDYIGLKNLLLNATFRYEWILPDKEVLRDSPLSGNKEEVDRDLGDDFEFEISGDYRLSKGWGFSLLYKYGFKLEDRASGNNPNFNYSYLEEDTDCTEHVGVAGLSYTTVPLYQEKKFSLPLSASLQYRNRFAGSNKALNSQYISLGIQIFF